MPFADATASSSSKQASYVTESADTRFKCKTGLAGQMYPSHATRT